MKGVAKKIVSPYLGIRTTAHLMFWNMFVSLRKSLAEGWMDEVWRIWSKQIFLVKCKQNPGGNWHYLRTFNSRLKPNEFFIASLTSQNNSDHLPFKAKSWSTFWVSQKNSKYFFALLKSFFWIRIFALKVEIRVEHTEKNSTWQRTLNRISWRNYTWDLFV